MIVWGGYNIINYYNTGGIYDPATDTWTPISTTNAPSGRIWHTAVWTGSKMIVWGGYASTVYNYSGGIYDPATDTWTPISAVNAPTGRDWHTAIWTGSKMILWGGYNGAQYYNTGGIYDPATDTWTSTTDANAPSGRYHHTAVWTGTRMIAWGGSTNTTYFNTGGIYYNPSVTGITNITTEAPEKYSLSQNYPNPFNPSTIIKFSIPNLSFPHGLSGKPDNQGIPQTSVGQTFLSSPHGLSGDLVQLKVYDNTGREVQTLINESLSPGTYQTVWDASKFSTGIYYYKLTTSGYTETKRMLLIK
jgi:hypothetical protein